MVNCLYEMSDDSSTEIFVYMGGDMVVPGDVVRVRVHPSVTVIPESAFYNRQQLQEVEFCEGLLEIGERAFHSCKSLRSIKIPSTVTVIRRAAFGNCEKLETIQLNEGLLEIGEWTFNGCTSLNAATITSTVRMIDECAFYDTRLSYIYLPDGVESIGERAFSFTKLLNFRMPQSITTISRGLFSSCHSLFSVELPGNTTQIGIVAFVWCHSLRNVALPISAEIADGVFNNCSDLWRLFDTQEQIINALKHRFDNLPIHKMVYYHSYNNLTSDQLNEATNMRSGQSRSLRSKLNPTGREQDCLGMTPLHILACSTVQNISLYQMLIDRYPENLITEDQWGAVPILYVVWGNEPNEIIHFLVERLSSLYPNYQLNFTTMVETLGKASAPSEVIQNLLDLQQESFPEQGLDWNLVLATLSTPRIKPHCSEATFRFLVKCSIAKRINVIGLKQWRDRLSDGIEFARPLSNGRLDRLVYLTMIRSKLAEYEAEYHKLKEAITILELALWKNKMNDCSQGNSRRNKRIKIADSSLRKQCRINCGADIVIQHMLPYLV